MSEIVSWLEENPKAVEDYLQYMMQNYEDALWQDARSGVFNSIDDLKEFMMID